MLPHTHHGQLSETEHEMQHESADSLLDYVQLLFHTDMGDGHLEHFESGQGLDFEVAFTAVVIPFLGFVTEHVYMVSGELSFIAGSYFLKDDPFPDSPIHIAYSLRGPPAIS